MAVIWFLWNSVFKSVQWLMAIVLLVALWMYDPQVLNGLMDQNLAILKYCCGLVPPPYGPRAESILRTSLHGDTLFLFGEAKLLVWSVVSMPRFVHWLVRG